MRWYLGTSVNDVSTVAWHEFDGHVGLDGDGVFSVKVGSAEGCYDVSAAIVQNARINYLAIRLVFENAELLSVTDRYYHIRYNIRHGSYRYNDITPMYAEVRQGEGRLALRTVCLGLPSEIRVGGGAVEYEVILDAPFLHDAWDLRGGKWSSKGRPERSIGDVFSFSFQMVQLQRDEITVPVLLCIPPAPCRAVLAITDHCDFDTPEKINLLFGNALEYGLIQAGVRITKGVFFYGPKGNEVRKSADLELIEYKKIIDRAAAAGNEIAPHALKHSGQLSDEDIILSLGMLRSMYGPATWIDHGSYLSYCYSQDFTLSEGRSMHEVLRHYGYRGLWSFHDIWQLSIAQLNMNADSRGFLWPLLVYMSKIMLMFKMTRAAHVLRSAYYAWSKHSTHSDVLTCLIRKIKEVLLSDRRSVYDLYKVYRKCKMVGRYTERFARNYKQKSRSYASPLCTASLKAISMAHRSDDMYLFHTQEVSHLAASYSQRNLRSMIEQRGVHIGHTYLSNELQYQGGIFSNVNGRTDLRQDWKEALRRLSLAIERNEIWNPTMKEFMDRMDALRSIRITMLSGAVYRVVSESPLPSNVQLLCLYGGRHDVISNEDLIQRLNDDVGGYDLHITPQL